MDGWYVTGRAERGTHLRGMREWHVELADALEAFVDFQQRGWDSVNLAPAQARPDGDGARAPA